IFEYTDWGKSMARQKGSRTGRCQGCNHLERVRIERLLAAVHRSRDRNRWFEKRNGLAMGLLMAANAAGQLLFLPLLAMLAEQYGWQAISIAVTLAVACMLPIVALLVPESPAQIGLAPSAPPWRYAHPRGRATRSPSPSPPCP